MSVDGVLGLSAPVKPASGPVEPLQKFSGHVRGFFLLYRIKPASGPAEPLPNFPKRRVRDYSACIDIMHVHIGCTHCIHACLKVFLPVLPVGHKCPTAGEGSTPERFWLCPRAALVQLLVPQGKSTTNHECMQSYPLHYVLVGISVIFATADLFEWF